MPDLTAIPTEQLLRELSSRYKRAYFAGEPVDGLDCLRWHHGEAREVFPWAESMARMDWQAFQADANRLGVEA